jgi:hypothetical protein
MIQSTRTSSFQYGDSPTILDSNINSDIGSIVRPYFTAIPACILNVLYMPQTPGSQQLNFGLQLRTAMKSPTEFILAGVRDHRGVPMASSASASTLSCDESGQQFRSLQAAAAARRNDLESIFTAAGMVYPFLPVDQDLTEFPLTFNNPITTSVNDKLWHQVERISRYFRNHDQ